jgi:anaerobic ribonucleoside-triphosphate reductase
VTVNDLVHRLEGNERYEYRVAADNTVTIADKHITIVQDGEEMHPVTSFAEWKLKELTWQQVQIFCAKPFDVDHITRVTGYFSKTSGWNKGKTGELRDRHRARLETIKT